MINLKTAFIELSLYVSQHLILLEQKIFFIKNIRFVASCTLPLAATASPPPPRSSTIGR
jgi:hypothetical protein